MNDFVLDQASAVHRDQHLTDEFWAAASRRELVRPVCADCGTSFFSPRWACPACLSENWTYQRSTGRGTIYSHTVVHRGPDETWDAPYVLAIIDLDEGWTMLSRVVCDDPISAVDAAWGGDQVEVTFIDEGRPPHRTLPVFTRIGASS